MILSCDTYDRLASGRRQTFSEAYAEFTSRYDLAELDFDPDEILRDVRDKDPGRDIDL
jgi:muramidase (phage lysozyme)